jgi:signal transduction histidine kinase
MLGLTVVSIIAFMVVARIAQQETAVIDQLAESISTHSVASIDALTTVRGSLHRAGRTARETFDDVVVGAALDSTAVEEHLRQLEKDWRDYERTALHPGEAEPRREAAEAIANYPRQLRRVLQRLSARDVAHAREVVDEALLPAGERADDALEHLIRFNAEQASATGKAIQQERGRASWLSSLMHGLVGLLVLLGTVFVAVLTRQGARLAASRSRFLAESRKAAERRAAELEAFAGRVAHDLKNPIGAALLHLSLAQRTARVHGVERAEFSLKRAVTMIDGLLEFARAGATADPSAQANLNEAVAGAISDVALDATRIGAQIFLDPGPTVHVACGKGPLACVLGNLIGNAVKYLADAPASPRTVRIRIRPLGSVVRVEIEDTGPGIAPQFQRSIFQPYFRAVSGKQPGVGLGLATVERIVTSHGGNVGVISKPGAGSCFWFELPLAARDTRATASADLLN